jgi:hypothetical protein
VRTTDGAQEVAALDAALLDGGVHASPVVARVREPEVVVLLAPWLEWRDARLARRVVQTGVRGRVALLEWRHRAHGRLVSELGADVVELAHALAGTQRLCHRLRAPQWSASGVLDARWQQAARG